MWIASSAQRPALREIVPVGRELCQLDACVEIVGVARGALLELGGELLVLAGSAIRERQRRGPVGVERKTLLPQSREAFDLGPVLGFDRQVHEQHERVELRIGGVERAMQQRARPRVVVQSDHRIRRDKRGELLLGIDRERLVRPVPRFELPTRVELRAREPRERVGVSGFDCTARSSAGRSVAGRATAAATGAAPTTRLFTNVR